MQLFTPKPCTSFFIVYQMETKTLHCFLHQNPKELFHEIPTQPFTPKPCTAFNTRTLHSLFAPKLCTTFHTKTLHSFLHQNPVQLFPLKKKLHTFLHQNIAQLFTPKSCTGFYTKTLHIFAPHTLRSFLHQNPAHLLTTKTFFFVCVCVDQMKTKTLFAPEPCTAF